MSPPDSRPRLLLVGGGAGLVGHAVLREFGSDYQIRSLHRSASPEESNAGIDWWPVDIASYADWDRAFADVAVVLNVAWYRWGKPVLFAGLLRGLERMLEAARRSKIRRFLHLSVPDAPPELESQLPYLTYKRQFDRSLAESGLSYAILRPTMLFGPGDRLLTVMLRLMHRYPVFPMFGSGQYHVSPIAVPDLARALHLEAESDGRGVRDLGGPERYEYRALTDRMFQSLKKRPRYWSFSDRGSVRLARLVQSLGSSLLYAYEVEWLLSDRLGLPAYGRLDRPLTRVEPFLDREAENLQHAVRG
ncbi:MAG: NAD-dependent epimerase/dehydratase family protein [Thermoplasmata archaeon]